MKFANDFMTFSLNVIWSVNCTLSFLPNLLRTVACKLYTVLLPNLLRPNVSFIAGYKDDISSKK